MKKNPAHCLIGPSSSFLSYVDTQYLDTATVSTLHFQSWTLRSNHTFPKGIEDII